MRKKIIFIFFFILLIFSFFFTFSLSVYAWIPGSAEGRVQVELPDGTRMPLPGIKIFRQDYWTFSYCSPTGSKCLGYKDGVETTTDENGYYYLGNGEPVKEGPPYNKKNNPPPLCKNQNSATRCPTGEKGKITPFPCGYDTSHLICPDTTNTQICSGVFSHNYNWCGFNCGSNPHRWEPYFPNNYRLPGNLETLGYSISNGQWQPQYYEENFANESAKTGKDFIFKLNSPPTPTPTNTPTPTLTPTPTNTPTPTLTPTNTPTPTPTYIPVTLPTYRPGQTNPLNVVRPAQAWYCLKSEYYNGSVTPGGKNNHRLTLTGEGFPNGARVYIVGCIATTGNINKCTTGQSNLDQQLLIEKAAGHEFIVDGDNPITVGEDGRINKIVYSHSQESTIHSFYGVFLLGTGQGDGSSSLQYATFASRQDVTRCTAVRWDPYGRVFDSQSLEPIPNVNILLTNAKKEKVNLPGFINPQKTNDAGLFNFMVEEGSYYLYPTPPKGYQFSNKPNLNSNYYLAYSNIYKPNDLIIEETGTPEHRDIPLDPGNNPPFESEVKSITFAVLPVKNGKQTKIVGQVSHPLTIISLKQKNKEIAKTTADKMGYYEIIIDNKNIIPGQPIVPYFTKFPFSQNKKDSNTNKNIFQKITSFFLTIFQKKTKASNLTLGLPIDPLPYYLEGYLEPNSIINIRLSSNNELYFQTRTDQNGYLSIKPENLPNFNYYLEIISNNHPPTILSISDFINRNKKYLEEKGINLYRN